jgi:hypothetical protein
MRRILIFLLVLPLICAHYGGQSGDVSLSIEPREPPLLEQPSKLFFSIVNTSALPMTVDQFDIMHERKMHVFIIGPDLQTFTHTHPEDYPEGFAEQSAGVYRVDYTFNLTGMHAVVLDYSSQRVPYTTIIPVNALSGMPSTAFVPDYNRTKQFGDYTVTLSVPDTMFAEVEIPFSYHIERNNLPVTDLQLLLGSEMHVVAVDTFFSTAGHTHAYIPGHTTHYGAMPQRYSGPTIPVHYVFPKPGTYVLFSQFRENNVATTTNFVVDVLPLDNQTLADYQSKERTKKVFAQRYEIILVLVVICAVFPLLVLLGRKKRKH